MFKVDCVLPKKNILQLAATNFKTEKDKKLRKAYSLSFATSFLIWITIFFWTERENRKDSFYQLPNASSRTKLQRKEKIWKVLNFWENTVHCKIKLFYHDYLIINRRSGEAGSRYENSIIFFLAWSTFHFFVRWKVKQKDGLIAVFGFSNHWTSAMETPITWERTTKMKCLRGLYNPSPQNSHH